MLIPKDSKSMIFTNTTAQTFVKVQSGISLLGRALDSEAKNIRSMNIAFQEFDEMMRNSKIR